MAKTEYVSKYFRITHTLEEEGPHPTIPYDYYDDTYTITAVLQGEGTCYVEGNGHGLSDGVIVVLSPEEIRSFRLKQTGRHERISLYFSEAVLSPVWDYDLPLMQIFRAHAPGSGNRFGPDRYDTETVMPVLDKLRGVLREADGDLKASRAHLLILELLFALYQAENTQAEPAVSLARDRKIGEICKYIKENLTEDLSYSCLQERFFVSRYQLTEVFRRNTGMTLTEYIIHKRLMQALLYARSGEGLENAAYRAGFHTYSHFYKEFKKRYHVSPKEYCDCNK